MTLQEAERLLDVLRLSAQDLIGRQPPDSPEANGMRLLLQYLVSVLDFRALVEAEPTEPAARAAADSYCRGHCPCAVVGPPGEHKRCDTCPLRPITIGLEQQQITNAMEDKNGT
jgi:hypothetical protein